MKEYLVKLAHYNLWANQNILSIIPEDDNLFNKEVQSSFPSIKSTLLHIWDAQYIWLTRLKDQAINDIPSKNFKGDSKNIRRGLIHSSEEFYLYLDKQLPTYDTKISSYKTIAGVIQSSTTIEIVAHCMNHSTFHRGQLITILRELGCTNYISTDMIAYFLHISQVKKDILD